MFAKSILTLAVLSAAYTSTPKQVQAAAFIVFNASLNSELVRVPKIKQKSVDALAKKNLDLFRLAVICPNSVTNAKLNSTSASEHEKRLAVMFSKLRCGTVNDQFRSQAVKLYSDNLEMNDIRSIEFALKTREFPDYFLGDKANQVFSAEPFDRIRARIKQSISFIETRANLGDIDAANAMLNGYQAGVFIPRNHFKSAVYAYVFLEQARRQQKSLGTWPDQLEEIEDQLTDSELAKAREEARIILSTPKR
jgi:hypothetical protein